MVHFNRTNEFAPLGYPGADLRVWEISEQVAPNDDGLYYRSRVFPELAQAVGRCIAGEQSFAELPFDAYQSWNETAWKVPHGSKDATNRFVDKFAEELAEAEDALEEFWDTRDKTHLVEEIGDVNWVVNALASNGKAVIGDSLKERVYAYLAGTRVLGSEGSFDYPGWYDAAAQFTIKRGSPTIGDIDNLVRAGFVPQPSPIMNLYEDETVSPFSELAWNFRMYMHILRNLNEQLHGSDQYIASDSGQHISAKIGTITAETTLRIAAIANYAGSSLEEVVTTNIQKVNSRIEQKTIDKTDGDRGQNA